MGFIFVTESVEKPFFFFMRVLHYAAIRGSCAVNHCVREFSEKIKPPN